MCIKPRVCRHQPPAHIWHSQTRSCSRCSCCRPHACSAAAPDPQGSCSPSLWSGSCTKTEHQHWQEKHWYPGSRLDLWYLLVLVAQEVGKALSPPFPHSHGLQLTRAKYKCSNKILLIISYSVRSLSSAAVRLNVHFLRSLISLNVRLPSPAWMSNVKCLSFYQWSLHPRRPQFCPWLRAEVCSFLLSRHRQGSWFGKVLYTTIFLVDDCWSHLDPCRIYIHIITGSQPS